MTDLPYGAANGERMRVWVALSVLLGCLWGLQGCAPSEPAQQSQPVSNAALATAFARQRSDVQLQGVGEVIRLLSDDNKGRRHQRFILRVSPEQTVLVAHNIDLAPRIDSLAVGDQVAFFGEYEWNPKGGVLHWTHHDPRGRHVGGWLKHHGRVYQ